MTAAAPSLKRLWAIRHPAVERFAGAVGHLELAQLAPAAPLAEAAAPALAALGLRRVITSPRRRCHDIAEHLAAQLGIPLHVEPRLRELDHGRWTGHSWDAMEAYDHAAYRRWLTHWISEGPPDGGESANQLTARVRAVIVEAPSDCLLVTHRGPLQAIHSLTGLSWTDAAAAPCPLFGEPHALLSVEAQLIPSFTVRCQPRYEASFLGGSVANHDS